ncbi:MAG: carboxypeptidase regulatory-like domain-containing protein [Pirellulaceae bacterium]
MSSLLPWASPLFSWMIQSAIVSSVLLAIGYLVAAACRQPVDRLRVLQWAVGVTLVSLFMTALPSQWKLAIPIATRPPGIAHENGVSPSLPSFDAPPRASFERDGQPREARTTGEFTTSDSAADLIATESSTHHSDTCESLPAVASSSTSARTDWLSLVTLIVTMIYLAGVALCLVRWCVARLRLWRMYRASREVPARIDREFATIAGERSNSIQLRTSTQIRTPIAWGLWSPVIMLPASVVTDDDDNARLRYFLAHEWAHIERRDTWSWQLTVCLHFFLYYNPLFWAARRTLLVSMDQLADARAAGHGESVADYAEFLVRLARDSQRPQPQLALGISDKHSQLRKRVECLLRHNGVTRLFCSPLQTIAVATFAIVVGVAGSAVRFEARAIADEPSAAGREPTRESQHEVAADASKETVTPAELLQLITDIAKPQVAELLKVCCQEHEDGSITYYGFVTDATSEMPISGATVKVHHKLSRDPKTGGWSTIEVTEHESNAIGMYSFTLPPEQTAESSLYIEVEANHPDFAAKGRSGYSHGMIRKNLELGELPFYTQIKLWPGKAIEGTVVSPDGTPLTDVEIAMYSASDKATGFPAGSFDKTTTDSNGHFRIVPPTPGDGVLWIKPANFAPQALRIRDRRGDWGTIRTELGANVTGHVLDVNGAPVANVRIDARRRGDGEEADEYLNSNAVANNIGRRVVTEDDGTFTLPSLPDGEYSLEVEPNSEEGQYDPPPLKDVFLRQSIKVADKKPLQITIRAVPYVVLQGTYLDSENQPRSGHEVMLFGRINDGFYFTRSSTPGKDGKFELKIPHGLREAKMDLITNEHSALKWRMSRDEPLHRGRNVSLGTVEDDIYGFEVVRYTAPILMVKAVDQQGRVVRDVTPIVTYTTPANESEEMTMYTTGSQVSFEAQSDGRHRSSQLLPDETITVTVKKDGFETTPQEVKLEEGQNLDVEFIVKPAAKSDPPDGTSDETVTGTFQPQP